jgi:leucyl/phenylalanyl-tRNA---protein transferase
MPIYLLDENTQLFPPVEEALEDGLLAIGGDLKPERLLHAYANGIFPWYDQDHPIMWWSPNPRMALVPNQMKVSKSLRQAIRNSGFQVKFDQQFEQVMKACGTINRKNQQGSWITDDMVEAYVKLHKMGYAHSVETYHKGKLAGGLYGVSLGSIFFGESMFHTQSNASKVALFHLVQFALKNRIELIDVQQETSHLASLGAKSIKRHVFLDLLKKLVNRPTLMGNWENGMTEAQPQTQQSE